MPSIDIDEQLWPIVVITFSGEASNEEFRGYLDYLAHLEKRRQKMATVLHTLPSHKIVLSQNELQARWLKERKETLKQYSVGTAFVFHSAGLRFVLSTVFLVQPIPTPYTVCATLEEALAWARDRLRDHGILVRAPSSG